MNTLIAISGACHSGKSTLISSMCESTTIKALHEIIRKRSVTDIDAIREDPESYLEFQEDVIMSKIRLEDSHITSNDSRIAVADRSLVDSLYYLITYLDKAKLSQKCLQRYHKLVDTVISAIQRPRYTAICVVIPINIPDAHNDTLRPKALATTQQAEYHIIKAMVLGFCTFSKNSTQVFQITGTDLKNRVNQLKSIINHDILRIHPHCKGLN